MNTTEKYIIKAVEKAKEELAGTSISNCNFNVEIDSSCAADALSKALLKQAEANEKTSTAMLELAKSLKPTEVYALKIDGSK